MSQGNSLQLHEQMVLLALRDESGTHHSGVWSTSAVAGGLLAELAFHGAIKIDEHDREVEVISTAALGNPLLDDVLGRISASKKLQTVQFWIGGLGADASFYTRTVQALCDRGILRMTKAKRLFFFTVNVYPERDGRPERELRERLTQVMFHGQEPDARETALISLAHFSGALVKNFDKHKLEQHKERIEQISKGDLVGDGAGAGIQAAQAAQAMQALQTSFLVTMVYPTIIMS